MPRLIPLLTLLMACAQGQAIDGWGGSGRDEVSADVVASDPDGGGLPADGGATSDAAYLPTEDAARDAAGACVPTTETCNGRDDDCDSAIDEAASCPCTRVESPGRAYLLCDDARSWNDAQARCRALGYELAVIETATEDALLYAEIAAGGFEDTWIGMSDAVAEGVWAWVDGTPFTYTHWDAGEPNDGGESGEDCGVIMTRAGREAEWDDRPCPSERPHVCESDGGG